MLSIKTLNVKYKNISNWFFFNNSITAFSAV
jgi:hypothetical protein